MEQHPIPQHLASFQFKLFGNLTTRQFVTLAIPLGFATLIFFSNLAPIIRLPLALILGLFGAFAALVPLGGRPFDKWIVAFVRAVFAPTQRIWTKEKNMPEFLNVVIAPAAAAEQIPEQITMQSRDRMLAYLRSLPAENETPLDIREQMAISGLNLSTYEAGEGKLPPAIVWPTSTQVQPTVVIGDENKVPAAWAKTSIRTGDIEKEALFEEAPFDKSQGEQIEKAVNMRGTEGTKGTEGQRDRVVKDIKIKVPKVEAVGVPFVAGTSQGKPTISRSAKAYVLPVIEDRLREKVKPFDESQGKPLEIYRVAKTHLASEANFSLENIFPVRGPNNEVRLMRGVGSTRVRKLHFAPPENFDLSKLPIRGEGRFEISQELARRFHFDDQTPAVVLPSGAGSSVASVNINIPTKAQEATRVLPKQAKEAASAHPRGEQSTNLEHPGGEPGAGEVAGNERPDSTKFSVSDVKQLEQTQKAPQSAAHIIPLTSTPNVISGLVTDTNGVPVDGAVLVVRDTTGIPIRALKTNKLGQFLSATPLGNGTYTIEVESETVKIQPSSINLTGEVLQPLALSGEGVSFQPT